MDADSFVLSISTCAESLETSVDRDMSAEQVSELRQSHSATRLIPSVQELDPLEDLSMNFANTFLEVGMLNFHVQEDEVISTQIRVVGHFEVDLLCISQETKEVFTAERTPDYRLLYRCALNGARFLDAASLAACYLARRSVESFLSDDRSKDVAQAMQCTEAAGGLVYEDFWFILLGAE